jgi:hypothetical protein
MKTTLNRIAENGPCADGWKKLLRGLGETTADNEPLSILQILDINGLNDALWCLRAVENHDKEIRLFSVWCARQVRHLMTDQRSVNALNVAENFANGAATEEELDAAWAAARAAAGDVAGDAEGDAAWAAAWAAAWDAAGDAAWAAARAAAWAAAWDAAGDAAWAAARAAAGDAARAAAWDVAGDAAGDAAWAAAWAAQEKKLRSICALIEEQL